jgi:hypothetical protein
MAILRLIPLLLLQLSAALGVNLYAAGTRGTVISLALELSTNGSGVLTRLDSSTECGGAPSWLTLDSENGVLYCIDDTTSGQGSIHSFDIAGAGRLAHISSINTPIGPVSSTLYRGPGSKRLAVAF